MGYELSLYLTSELTVNMLIYDVKRAPLVVLKFTTLHITQILDWTYIWGTGAGDQYSMFMQGKIKWNKQNKTTTKDKQKFMHTD